MHEYRRVSCPRFWGVDFVGHELRDSLLPRDVPDCRRRFVFRRRTRVEHGRRRRCIIYDWIPFDICVRARRERAPAADKIDQPASRNVKYRVNHVRIRRTNEQRRDWDAVYRVGETVRQKWAFRDRRVHRRGEVRAAAA